MGKSVKASVSAKVPEVEKFLPLVAFEDIGDVLAKLMKMPFSVAIESLADNGPLRVAMKEAVLGKRADGPGRDGITRIAPKIELLREWSFTKGYGHSFDEFQALLLEFLNSASCYASVHPFVIAVGGYADKAPEQLFRQKLLRTIRFVQLYRDQAEFSRDLFHRLLDIDHEDMEILCKIKELGGDRYFVTSARIKEELTEVNDLRRRRKKLVDAKLVESRQGKGGGAKLTRTGYVAVKALS